METSSKRVVDWDDDDPYQIPDDRLPKIKEGEIGVEIEEPKKHKHHENKEKSVTPERLEEIPEPAISEETEEKHKKKHRKHKKHEDSEENEIKGVQLNDGENDPLKNPPKHELETKKEETSLYPSMHEIVKHVDEKNEKEHPEKKENHKKHNNGEGHQSCKKCLIQ